LEAERKNENGYKSQKQKFKKRGREKIWVTERIGQKLTGMGSVSGGAHAQLKMPNLSSFNCPHSLLGSK
jgi:hypothetical protein